MKTSKIIFIYLIFITITYANSNCQNRSNHIHYYNDIAITQTDRLSPNDHDAGTKLILQKVVLNKGNKKPFLPRHKLENPFWIITGNELPINEDTCIKNDVDGCEPNTTDRFRVCYHSCAQYGPEFLTYDIKKNDLYFFSPTANTGQGGGPILIFVANIKTKAIKYLRMMGGFISAEVSPNSNYIAFYGNHEVTIYDLKKNKDVDVVRSNSKQLKGNQVLMISDLHWVNDTQFEYVETIMRDKFTIEGKQATQYRHDINSRSNIKTTIISDDSKLDGPSALSET